MTHALRPSTLETIGLGTVLDLVRSGGVPAAAPDDLVDEVFGPASDRGALVISGANGIVGAGKTMQLGSRLEQFGVPIVALDFPGVPDGIGKQYPGLQRAFGRERAASIMSNTIQLSYDGTSLPRQLQALQPRFLLEAIPEILDVKKAHYEIFRGAFPGIEIRSVTSGFPQHQLGVGIAHPAFPHEINKVFEIVEPEPSAVTKLLWALGLMPMRVSDHWSFVLDVLFCGLTLAATRYHEASNMPFWKADKYIRKHLGPNPLRAHDAIGAAGANFLTWSCLHHLAQHYGDLYQPTASLEAKKDSGENWYPHNHFRPLVNWTLDDGEVDELLTWVLGPILQMTSLLVHEQRSHLTQINAIGELCAQFTRGVLAVARSHGADGVISTVEAYHRLHPAAAGSAWYPDVFAEIDSPAWQQLYVNAEHDGNVGVISLCREAYNWDVNAELNRAIDWLKAAGIDRVIVTGDFHLTTQLVGADTGEFYDALNDEQKGVEIARSWSATARRLRDEFTVSVGIIAGKRCLGGMFELMFHCDYVVAVEDAEIGLPEVTIPVVPGMEACHWVFRKSASEHWPKLLSMLLEGRRVKPADGVGWLIDAVGPQAEVLGCAWKIASGKEHGIKKRELVESKLTGVLENLPTLSSPVSRETEATRKAILDSIRESCSVPLAEALEIQARHAGAFMASSTCMNGSIGALCKKTMAV